MCGIAGIFSKNTNLDPQLIIKMTDIIKYRGPDGFGYLGYNSINNNYKAFSSTNQLDTNLKYNLYFGHRRLSIIDLSEAGKQPMPYLDNRYWITYNGEIYNYLEIKEELKQKGYKFHSHTDTEVILASYDFWGKECLNKFNGMWAFAILDIAKSEIFCSRDRLGVKPFYYYLDNNYFAFSSEIKQLLSLPFIKYRLNDEAVFNYFVGSAYNALNDTTFFKEIKQLEGGTFLKINLKIFQCVNNQKYWDIDLNNKVSSDLNYEYLTDKYYELFSDSVKLRLRSDVAVGSALSGGLDSSGIVCMVDRALKKNTSYNKQKTFTSVSRNKMFDEKNYADIVISRTSVDPYFTEPSWQKLIYDYRKLIWHQDEPFISTSIFAGWCVSELTKSNNITVTLDGQGPDEMMGGYYPFPSVLAEDLRTIMFNKFIKDFCGFRNKLRLSPHQILYRTFITFVNSMIPDNFRFNSNPYKNIFNKNYSDSIDKTQIINQIKIKFSNNYFDNYSYKATTINPLPGILKQVDRNSMAFSVESRLPFLDYRLVEFVFSLPMELKVNKADTKIIYRDAVKDLIPIEIFKRNTKLGFVTPEPVWIKNNLKNIFLETFDSNVCSDFLDKKFLINKFNNFLKDKEPFSTIFWQVFNFLIWYNIFFENKDIDHV